MQTRHLIMCCLMSSLALAQERQPKAVFKLAPLSFIDFDNTIQAGVEVGLDSNKSIQTEFGYGRYSFNVWDDSPRYPNTETWRWRSEFRRYFSNHKKRPFAGSYWAVEFLFKQMNARQMVSIGRECTDNSRWTPCGYYEYVDYRYVKYALGAHFKLGHQFVIVGEPNTYIDWYMGVGLRQKYQPMTYKMIPSYDGEIIKHISSGRTDNIIGLGFLPTFSPATNQLYPSVVWGVKIGFGVY